MSDLGFSRLFVNDSVFAKHLDRPDTSKLVTTDLADFVVLEKWWQTPTPRPQG